MCVRACVCVCVCVCEVTPIDYVSVEAEIGLRCSKIDLLGYELMRHCVGWTWCIATGIIRVKVKVRDEQGCGYMLPVWMKVMCLRD
jgi:hypothetical protein